MQVALAKEALHDKIHLLEKVSGRQVTLPVLRGIHLATHQGGVTLTATNLDVGISAEVPGKVAAEGEVVVPASLFASVVGSLPRGGTVSLSLEEGQLLVAGGSSQVRLATLPAEEFPSLPQVEEGVSTTLPAVTLVSALRSVWHCASTSTIKPELASVYLFAEAGSLVSVATDSFRLAEKRLRLPSGSSIEPLLLPIRNTPDVVRVFESAEGDVALEYNQNQLAFRVGDVYCTSRLTDGSFPDYQQIIPREFLVSVVALREELAAAVRKAALFAGSFNQVTLSIDPDEGVLVLRAESSEVGAVEDRVACAIEGEALTISFNQKYLADSVSALETDSVTLSAAGPGRPLVVRGVGDESFLGLVMPMNR
ncbi:DNA polymerase III subunit beta [Patescibacteria group bacterium]|jgi:DNA polymerase-3 subunit beta|nr:DNA polymerase III subunit beta [Patescibacteria group bacterium]